MTPVESAHLPRILARDYAHVPSTRSMVRRLGQTYARTNEATREDGHLWYARAGLVVETLSERYGIDPDPVAGVLAVTSPRVGVARNVTLARDVLATYVNGGDVYRLDALTERVHAARLVLDGVRDPIELDPGQLSRSRKVRSFYANLTGNLDAVTLDVWALRAVGVSKDVLEGGAYVKVAHAYRRVADRLGITPRDLQAIAWIDARGREDSAEELAGLVDLARAEPTVAAPTTGRFVTPV